jgi:hypothetical protein
MSDGATASGANVTHEELQAQFFPLGEWPEKDTRERIQFIIGEGLQAGEWSWRETIFAASSGIHRAVARTCC